MESLIVQEPATTAVIINFRTPDLVRRAGASFRYHYPNFPLLLIDNGSHDDSINVLHTIKQQAPQHTEIIFNDRNLHHGPAMDQALHHLHSPYVLFLDSDCEVRNGGFIEAMVRLLEQHPTHYIIGKRIFVNKRGFAVEESTHACPYIRPICMMVKRELYLKLPKFQHHGAPCLDNMRTAIQYGLGLLDFPVEEYVDHLGRGTASISGYQLGWRGKLNHLLNKAGL
jgi:glycosyltransferase involved in cell wall biosynthesis